MSCHRRGREACASTASSSRYFIHLRKYWVLVRKFLVFGSYIVQYITVPLLMIVFIYETTAAPEVGGAHVGGGEKKTVHRIGIKA